MKISLTMICSDDKAEAEALLQERNRPPSLWIQSDPRNLVPTAKALVICVNLPCQEIRSKSLLVRTWRNETCAGYDPEIVFNAFVTGRVITKDNAANFYMK